MAQPTGSTRRSRMSLPMTGMIDCVFQLLIFFILMPSVVADEGYLTTNLPRDPGPREGEAPPLDPQYVRIELHDVGPSGRDVRIVLNGHQVLGANFRGLQAALENLRRAGLSPTHPVLIQPTTGTRHKWIVRAMDAVVAARFENIRFAVPGEWVTQMRRPKRRGDTVAGAGRQGADR